MESSPQSESGLPPGGERGRGGAEVMVGRMVQDHTAGLLVLDTAAPTLLLRRHLAGNTVLFQIYFTRERVTESRAIFKIRPLL